MAQVVQAARPAVHAPYRGWVMMMLPLAEFQVVSDFPLNQMA